jgi:Ulp1 family protease
LTIAIYHQEEDARKLLDSIMRERSQEEKDFVTKVLEVESSTEPLVSQGPDSLTRQSMQTLCHGDWVNDEVINFFGKVCLNKHDVTLCDHHGGRKPSHTFNSYFMRRLFDENNLDHNLRCVYNFANVATWSKKVTGENIFKMRYLFFPININDKHWTLAVVFMQDKCI